MAVDARVPPTVQTDPVSARREVTWMTSEEDKYNVEKFIKNEAKGVHWGDCSDPSGELDECHPYGFSRLASAKWAQNLVRVMHASRRGVPVVEDQISAPRHKFYHLGGFYGRL